MAYASFQEYKEQVLAASDLIAVAKEYGIITGPDGGVTTCPFHADSTASLSLRKTNQLFHCFGAGCGVSGDVIRLVERMDGLPFREALAKLAVRAGMQPYHASAAELTAIEVERQVADLTELAARHYHERLDDETVDYWCDARGLPEEMLDTYRIGTADGTLVKCVELARGTTYLPVLVHAGLAVRTSGMEYARDLLFRRMVIPITRRGQAVFLTGRALDPDMQPKYFHQKDREAPLFNEDALAGGVVFVTEGPLDALSLLAWGFPAVALQGGARASAIQKLAKCKRVYGVLDADAAGMRATYNLADALGDKLRVVTLPAGQDPNDYYRFSTKPDFEQMIAASLDPVTYLVRQIPSPCPPEQIEVTLAPVFTVLSHYTDTAATYYVEKVIAPALKLTSKAGLAALHKDLQATRNAVTQTCPFCRNTLRHAPGVRR